MRSFLLGALVLTLGCTDASPTGPGPSGGPPGAPLVTGTFTLYSVNGATLPTALADNVIQKYEVLEETYTLRDDYSFSRFQSYRVTAAATGSVTPGMFTQTGTFVAKTGSITFSGNVNGIAYTNVAARSGDDFILSYGLTQQTLLFRKQ